MPATWRWLCEALSAMTAVQRLRGQGAGTGWGGPGSPGGEAGWGCCLLPAQRLRKECSAQHMHRAASLAGPELEQLLCPASCFASNFLKVLRLCSDQPVELWTQRVVPSISICLTFGVCPLGMAQVPLCPSPLPDSLPLHLNPDFL